MRSAGNGPASMTLPARVTTLVQASTAADDTPLDLQYTATNFLIAPETGLPVVLKPRTSPLERGLKIIAAGGDLIDDARALVAEKRDVR